MTQEVLKLALEALERSVATCFDQYAHRQVMSQPDHFINQAITAIKEALREHAMREVQRLGQEIEQEPVGRFTGKFTVDAHDRMLCEVVCTGAIPTAGAALYTTPPQRTWVGLTDEEKAELDAEYGDDTLAHLDAIEAKLKEKNDVAQKTNS